jgi:hypothetical protein
MMQFPIVLLLTPAQSGGTRANRKRGDVADAVAAKPAVCSSAEDIAEVAISMALAILAKKVKRDSEYFMGFMTSPILLIVH